VSRSQTGQRLVGLIFLETTNLKISIVTVTYNCASFVDDCLVSVATQSYKNIEHVVVDGSSTDGTLVLLRARSDQLSALLSEPDAGIYDAMNKGLRVATGEVIGFLNADDFYANKDVLTKVANVFAEDPLIDACYSDLVYVDKVDTSRAIRYWQSSDFVTGAFAKVWCPPHPTFFVRRSVYERFGGFDLTYRIAADVELMMRFLEVHKIRVRYVPEVWVKMRMGGTTNKSLKNIWVQNQEVLRALRGHELPANPIWFFGHKLLSRGMQFLKRPSV
jgi:glycosyltransferase involved in cell wall biosynthesis